MQMVNVVQPVIQIPLRNKLKDVVRPFDHNRLSVKPYKAENVSKITPLLYRANVPHVYYMCDKDVIKMYNVGRK